MIPTSQRILQATGEWTIRAIWASCILSLVFSAHDVHAEPISFEALWNVVTESLEFGGSCGIDFDFDGTELATAASVVTTGAVGAASTAAISMAFDGNPNPCFGIYLKYNVPYYIVEVVPNRWQSLLAPDLVEWVREPIINTIEKTIQPFVEPLGINLNPEKSWGGSLGGGNYYDVHVYRLAFDIGEMVKGLMNEISKAVATHNASAITGSGFGWKDEWASPDICYLSEFDLLRWNLGVPMQEQKTRQLPSTCEACKWGVCTDVSCKKSWAPGFKENKHFETITRDFRLEDRLRSWEGVNQPGSSAWANLNERSGRVFHTDRRFATSALALRGASLVRWHGPLTASSQNGCWINGRGPDEFDPLDPEVLSKQYDEEGGVSIQLVHTSAGGPTWKSCVPVGWEAARWDREEYWNGDVSKGALYVIYQRRQMCLVDLKTYAENVGWLSARLGQDIAAAIVSLGGAVPAEVAEWAWTITSTIQQVRQMYEDVKKVLDFFQMIHDEINNMMKTLEKYRDLLKVLGEQAVTVAEGAGKEAVPLAINGTIEGLMTYFDMGAGTKQSVRDVQCSVDIGRHVLRTSVALTGLSTCGHGINDIAGAQAVGNKLKAVEKKIPDELFKEDAPIPKAFELSCPNAHAEVNTLHDKIKSVQTDLETLQSYLSYGDYACMAVRVVSNPPSDAEGFIRAFGALNLADTGPIFATLDALKALPNPDEPLNVALSQVRAIPNLAQAEITWWEQETKSVGNDLSQVNLTTSRLHDITGTLKRVTSPEMAKDLLTPIEQDVKGLFTGVKSVSTKMWEDMESLSRRGSGLLTEMKAMTKLKPKEPQDVIRILLAFASLRVEFDLWIQETQSFVKNMPEYQKELQTASDALNGLIGNLPDRLRKLDQEFANQIRAAVLIDPVPLRRAASRLDAMATRATTLPGAPPTLRSTLLMFSLRLDQLADAIDKLSLTFFVTLLDPVHKVLAKAADGLESLVGKGQASSKGSLLTALADVSGQLAGLGTELSNAQAMTNGALFAGNASSGSADAWEFLRVLESYARMQKGAGPVLAGLKQAKMELPEDQRSTDAIVGRYIRNTVPLRQEEIDKAGGDADAAADELEQKAREAYQDSLDSDGKIHQQVDQEKLKKKISEEVDAARERAKDPAVKEEIRRTIEEACRKVNERKGIDSSVCGAK